MKQVNIANLEDLRHWADEIAKTFKNKQIVLLSGPMGAGKTQLVKFFVQSYGGQEVSSPTFSIHHHYHTPRGPIEHFDLYRLENEDELESTGFWDFFANGEGLIFIEWAERISRHSLPLDWSVVEIALDFLEVKDSSKRQLMWN